VNVERSYIISDIFKALIITSVVVSILGYVDFITGEISIDVLYILCICLVTWYTNTIVGILCIIEIVFAKTTADYYDQVKIGSHLYEWNTLNFVLIYLIICMLVSKLKKVLTK
jgi:hypothetical protein